MPNWCYNRITLRHEDPAMIERAANSKGLLMEFLPTPQALIDTVAGSFGDEDKQNALLEQQARNVEEYGHPDWYSWNLANWGTKWDVELEVLERPDANTLVAAFDSAWSPPIEAYQKLEELGFEVDAEYYEPGMAFCGTYTTGLGESTIELSNYTAGTVRDAIGAELDDYFGISEEMAQYEDEE
jgi:hypothetical protein